MIVHFEIMGEPKGKGRPRFARIGGRVKAYTPAGTAAYEDMVRFAYRQAARGTFYEGPVRLQIECRFGIPKSVSKRKAEQMRCGEILPTKKPDADNIAKIIADALNGVAYRDDSQIAEMLIVRRYADIPAVAVEIQGIEKAKGGDLCIMPMN